MLDDIRMARSEMFKFMKKTHMEHDFLILYAGAIYRDDFNELYGEAVISLRDIAIIHPKRPKADGIISFEKLHDVTKKTRVVISNHLNFTYTSERRIAYIHLSSKLDEVQNSIDLRRRITASMYSQNPFVYGMSKATAFTLIHSFRYSARSYAKAIIIGTGDLNEVIYDNRYRDQYKRMNLAELSSANQMEVFAQRVKEAITSKPTPRTFLIFHVTSKNVEYILEYAKHLLTYLLTKSSLPDVKFLFVLSTHPGRTGVEGKMLKTIMFHRHMFMKQRMRHTLWKAFPHREGVAYYSLLDFTSCDDLRDHFLQYIDLSDSEGLIRLKLPLEFKRPGENGETVEVNSPTPMLMISYEEPVVPSAPLAEDDIESSKL
ncbi:hypothetical protein HDE_06216 [Halotydeus destructor]|nr:hypothetical protein HDE_06216 [Halotydeus destructor]